MLFTLVLGLLIALIAVIFAVQNPAMTTVSFFTLEFSQPLAIILLVSFGLGILMFALVSVPGYIKRRTTIAGQKKEISRLEKSVESINLELAESKVATEKVQAALFATKEELKTALEAAKNAQDEVASLNMQKKEVEASAPQPVKASGEIELPKNNEEIPGTIEEAGKDSNKDGTSPTVYKVPPKEK